MLIFSFFFLQDALQCKIDFQVTVYAMAILEYIATEILGVRQQGFLYAKY